MAEGLNVLSIIKQASKPPESESVDLVYGTVTNMQPLTVTIDSKLIVSAQFLELSMLCKPLSFRFEGEDILVWRGLQLGDKVKLLRIAKGNRYYVMERV